MNSKLNERNRSVAIGRLKRDIKALKKKIRSMNKSSTGRAIAKGYKRRLESMRTEVRRLEDGGIVITNHAIVRYLQRIYGLDIEEVKKEILPPGTELIVRQNGNGKYGVSNGEKEFCITVEGGSVVTVN